MSDEQLHTRYRPRKFKDVVGQAAAVSSIKTAIETGAARTFLLTGPAGTGKTTLARIAARYADCNPSDMLEVDAASNTGVDDMRNVANTVRYRPLGGASRAVIIDEAHRLSGNAWDSLLKVLEEPPAGVYWFLCTTQPSKVPATIKTRCRMIGVTPIAEAELRELAVKVLAAEQATLRDDIIDLAVSEANGSARQMLVNLGAVLQATTKRDAAALLKVALETDATLELCQFLAKGGSWMKAMSIVDKLEKENPESVRIIVVNYFGAASRKAKSEKEASRFLSVLDVFSQPFNSSERLAPLILAVGRLLITE